MPLGMPSPSPAPAPLAPPPGHTPGAAAAKPQGWWQKFLDSGFALPVLGGAVGAVGMATNNPTLQNAGFSFGQGAAENQVGNFQRKAEEARQNRSRVFEESQLRLRNLDDDVRKKRALANFVQPPQDPTLAQQAFMARKAIGDYDAALQADKPLTDAQARKIREQLDSIDWTALETEKATQTGVRTMEAEARVKRDIAGRERGQDIQALERQGRPQLSHEPPVGVMGPQKGPELYGPEDWQRAGNASLAEERQNKVDSSKVYPYKVGGVDVMASPAEIISSERQQESTRASERNSNNYLKGQELANQREQRLREDVDLERRRREYADEFRAYQDQGGERRDPGGHNKPHSPDEINDMLADPEILSRLQGLDSASFERALKAILPRQKDRAYAKILLKQRQGQLMPPPR